MERLQLIAFSGNWMSSENSGTAVLTSRLVNSQNKIPKSINLTQTDWKQIETSMLVSITFPEVLKFHTVIRNRIWIIDAIEFFHHETVPVIECMRIAWFPSRNLINCCCCRSFNVFWANKKETNVWTSYTYRKYVCVPAAAGQKISFHIDFILNIRERKSVNTFGSTY